MRKFYSSKNGFIEQPSWSPHSWVNVECPDRDDYEFMTGDLRVPADFLESVADADERPRIERDGDWILTILRVPLKQTEKDMPYITVPIGIITNNEVVVTVCNHYTDLIPDFISHTRIRGISIDNEPDFILRILYSATFWYLKYLKEISDETEKMEHELERSVRNQDLLALMRMQRSLVLFNTSLRGNDTLISKIEHIYESMYSRDLMEDVQIEMAQAKNTAQVYSDILAGMMDSFASIVSNNVNDIMKKMTGVSIVLMLPTLVASFYGMNVAIGYGSSPWAFFIIVGGSMALSAILYFFLKRINWL